jgi:predicted lipid carrier protein YhbT
MRFLSPEWLDAAAGALGGDADLSQATAGTSLTIQQVVRAGPDGEIVYRVRIDRGTIELLPGAGEADVVFTEDWQTAAAIAQGLCSPQAAFLDGRIRVAGNVSSVMGTQEALVGIDRALDDLRAATTYDR